MSKFQQAEPKQVYNDLGKFVGVEKETKNDKTSLIVSFIPTSGPLEGQVVVRRGFVTALKNSIETIKSLRVGDEVTLNVTLNQVGERTYRNLVGVQAGHVAITKTLGAKTYASRHTHNISTTASSKGDYNDRAAKGQALNLALQVAMAEGKHHDDDYILSLIPRMLKLGEAVQGGETSVTKTTTPQVAPQVTQQTSGVDDLSIEDDDDIFADLDL